MRAHLYALAYRLKNVCVFTCVRFIRFGFLYGLKYRFKKLKRVMHVHTFLESVFDLYPFLQNIYIFYIIQISRYAGSSNILFLYISKVLYHITGLTSINVMGDSTLILSIAKTRLYRYKRVQRVQ